MFPFASAINPESQRFLLVNNLVLAYRGTASGTLRAMLDDLNFTELKVVQQNEDLNHAIQRLAEASEEEMLRVLKHKYNLSFMSCENGECWIDAEGLEDMEPEWLKEKINHFGWYVGDLTNWCRRFLLQVVRVNIWMHLLEKSRTEKKSSRKVEDYETNGGYL